MDDNVIDDEEPLDVPGCVEIHRVAGFEENVLVNATESSANEVTKGTGLPPAKKRKERQGEMMSLENLRGKSPVECFEILFDNETVTYIVQQSVIYARQKNNHQFQLSNNCLKIYWNTSFSLAIIHFSQEQLYWCEDEDMNILCVRACMSRNRYLEIKRFLHISDNSDLERIPLGERDSLFKIRPLIDKLNDKFQQFGGFSESLSIDEQMVRYYGHHYLKQFIRGKSVRFGFKQWTICCSQTGYCYQTQVYEGKSKKLGDDESISGLGTSVVLQMVSILQTPNAHKVYFDNFFTGFSLMKHLQDIDVRATGTVRFKRMNKCPIATDKR
ncbi:piggyBac transposable element-derived protein 3-like [Stegodyphus dumicola]|uniref:piggyBac transposable element-derived protein 3-like n=1 Tax=Stegodyphus dumicola TaxID=202533 RepID=UPI0015A937FD|nr:piggyBac transposable element-derived protein 3-like [Stegodyphus dumicola]